MLKFFRRIRQKLLSEGQISKYLLYAIGEIVLVVIGILIAIQIDNLNSKRIESNRINEYYHRIHQELEASLQASKQYESILEMLLQKNERSLELLHTRNVDSLAKMNETLGALATVYAYSFSFPMVEEFLGQDYLSKIQNDKIKQHLQLFSRYLDNSKAYDDYIFNQYRTVIEPFFNKNINYAEVALYAQKKNLHLGGPQTDYSAFLDNLELWNILSFKVEVLTEQQAGLYRLLELIKKLDQEITKELENE